MKQLKLSIRSSSWSKILPNRLLVVDDWNEKTVLDILKRLVRLVEETELNKEIEENKPDLYEITVGFKDDEEEKRYKFGFGSEVDQDNMDISISAAYALSEAITTYMHRTHNSKKG